MTVTNTPLYQQVLEDLRAKIEDGTYPLGAKLPSEVELIKIYDVSRITVRRAVSELVSEGILVKEQGRGTFVRSRWLRRSLVSPVTKSFTEACAETGLTAGAAVVEVSIVPAPEHYASALGVEEDSLLVHVRRTRTADDWPVIDEHNYLPYEDFKALLAMDLNDQSLFSMLEGLGAVQPFAIEDRTVDAVSANADQARELGITSGSPLLKLSGTYKDASGRPIAVSRSYFVGGRMTFQL